jgi:predicted Zn-dependent protease
MGNWREAENNIDLLLEKDSNNPEYYNLKGFILLWQNRAKESLGYFKKALLLAPGESRILLNAGVSLSMTGQNQKANFFLNLASRNCPNDMIVFLALIENNIKGGNRDDAKFHTERLIKSFSSDEIKATLAKLSNLYESAPISKEIIAPWLEKKIPERIKKG